MCEGVVQLYIESFGSTMSVLQTVSDTHLVSRASLYSASNGQWDLAFGCLPSPVFSVTLGLSPCPKAHTDFEETAKTHLLFPPAE